MTSPKLEVLTPQNSQIIFIDHQPQMAFGVQSIDRQTLKNNVVGLAKAANVFKIPTTITTVETQSFSGYTYPELLDRLMQTKISGFTVEFARSDYDPAILKPYRDRLIVFGCIDPGNTPAPHVEQVKRRVAQALEHLDPERVLLAPDCGLMTISRQLAREKLQVMVAAARALRRER